MAEAYAGIRFDAAGFVKGELPDYLLQLAREIEAACKEVERAGLARGIAGNLSARCAEGFLITPTGTGLANVLARDVVLIEEFDFEKNVLKRALGRRLPSSETPMHSLVYARMKKVGAIAHIHAELDGIPGVPITESKLPYGTRESALAALKALAGGDVVVLRGHGAVAVGSKIGEAVAKIINKSA
ncbi:L-fuculose phosphate aldolase [Candidatus Burarchaeum australiense]|nr:L-fuculose phosphate aldolase [Candidatus Burarchaeum australiense]